MKDRILEDAGFTKNEIAVYKTLLQLGSTTAGPVAKKSGIHRSKVYDALARLILKGVVSYTVKANRKYYRAQNPDAIKSFMKEKLQKVESIIPELKAMQAMQHEKQEANVFEGYKGLKSVFDNQVNSLRKGDEILVFGARSGLDVAPETWKAYFSNMNRRRIKKGIRYKIIFNEDLRKSAVAKEFKKSKLTQVRFIKQKTLAGVNIHGNNVGIIVWKKKPYAFVITSKEASSSFREYFKTMWQMAKA
ncbi:TrmB family transcriptional regulator [Nanoarchaeota archaeon]